MFKLYCLNDLYEQGTPEQYEFDTFQEAFDHLEKNCLNFSDTENPIVVSVPYAGRVEFTDGMYVYVISSGR